MRLLQEAKEKNSDSKDSKKADKSKISEEKFTYSTKDVILYALGVGVTVKHDMSHLKFLYEGCENFSVLPTFAVIPAQVCRRK